MESPPQIPIKASSRAGHLVQQQAGPDGYSAFIPTPLPPNPPLDLSGHIGGLLERASSSLGRLDGLSRSLDPDRLLYMYVRKEAVLSSQIEGTQSTLAELLEFENSDSPGVTVEDVREVSRYVAALRYAIDRIAGGFPLSLRLIRDTHGVLMTGGRGGHQTPGEFRSSQNWIGGTRPGTARFVPPPPHELMRVLGDLEKFIVEGNATPIIKAGLAHAQFETIHPFLDGNGRLGRLLITMILCSEKTLAEPFLYLSLYFKQHRDDYYAALQRVRTDGDWEGWMAFYLEGVDWTARQATHTTTKLLELFSSDRERIIKAARAPATLRVYEEIQRRVIVSIRRVSETLNLSIPTVTTALRRLEELKIVRETTGRRYGRMFAYQQQLDILNETGQ
ncbi:MAG TPA: Fic family protein [Gemmatimonadaceae bacterium]|jgi:Fic family protein|nr:Fic family protein [Gemmatimonadaceae bacterium]